MSITENELKKLFDYQRFQRNPRLAKIIDEARADAKSNRMLSDDDLTQVAAAGEARSIPEASMRKDLSETNKPKEAGSCGVF